MNREQLKNYLKSEENQCFKDGISHILMVDGMMNTYHGIIKKFYCPT